MGKDERKNPETAMVAVFCMRVRACACVCLCVCLCVCVCVCLCAGRSRHATFGDCMQYSIGLPKPPLPETVRLTHPQREQAEACGPEIEAFLGCRCHMPIGETAGRCSKLMCQGARGMP